jgi:uncharacterized protein
MPDTAAPNLARRDVYVPHAPTIVGTGDEHRIRAVASTADLDRYNSVVEPSGMRAIRGTIPLLFSHDRTRPIGRIDSIENSASQITIDATITDAAIWDAVKVGAIAGVSIGFLVHHAHEDGETVWIDDWELIEVSIVTTPANANALITEVRSIMEHAASGPASAAPATRTVTPARTIVPRIEPRTEIAPGGAVLREISAAAPAIHRRGPMHFSISNVIAARISGAELTGIEREACTELQHRSYGPTHGDVRIPAGVFQRRDLSTNVGSGAALSPEQWMQQLLDDTAAARRWGTLTPRLGFTIVSTMRETIHVPKRTQALQADVIAKDADAPSSDTIFVPDELSPRYIATTTTLRRSAVRYSDPAADAIITQDIRRAIDDRTDNAVLFGAGGLEPVGLLTAPPPALVIDKAGDPIVTPDLFALKSLMSTAWKLDDALGALRWCTDPTLVDALRVTSKKASAGALTEWFSGVVPFNTGDGTLLDIMLVQSGRIAANADATHTLNLIMGEMGLVAYFGGAAIDLLIDPYSLSQQGSIRMTAFLDVNCIARDANIHAAITNIGLA